MRPGQAGYDSRSRGFLSSPDLFSVHLPRLPRPVRLAKLELLELARGRAGERVPDLDRRRALEVRHVVAAELDQVAVGRLRVRAEDDERLDRLAPLLVRDAD